MFAGVSKPDLRFDILDEELVFFYQVLPRVIFGFLALVLSPSFGAFIVEFCKAGRFPNQGKAIALHSNSPARLDVLRSVFQMWSVSGAADEFSRHSSAEERHLRPPFRDDSGGHSSLTAGLSQLEQR